MVSHQTNKQHYWKTLTVVIVFLSTATDLPDPVCIENSVWNVQRPRNLSMHMQYTTTTVADEISLISGHDMLQQLLRVSQIVGYMKANYSSCRVCIRLCRRLTWASLIFDSLYTYIRQWNDTVVFKTLRRARPTGTNSIWHRRHRGWNPFETRKLC